MVTVSEELCSNRKSWFRRYVGWLLKGVLLIALLFFLLIMLSYAYEDWSGAHAWAKAKNQLEAAGISLAPNTYIPSLVPDAENFAALPIFQLELDPKRRGTWKMLSMDRSLAPVIDNFFYPNIETYKPGKLPYLGDWERGEKNDLVVVRKQLSDFCQHTSPPIQVPTNATASEMLSLICPALADLRAENIMRPSCRFNRSYSDPSPEDAGKNVSQLQSQIELAEALAYEEKLGVIDGQPQLALDDLKVGWKITSGLQKEPLLIDGLVTAGVVAIHLKVINEGLARHTCQYLADYAPLILPGSMQMIDIASRRIFAEKEALNLTKPTPVARNWFAGVKLFAYAQVQVDEARIACRLERYHLAHGAYPDLLDKLATGYGEMPHDIMTGDSYHYKLNNDGTYVLYSVGWNQKDDGGEAGTFRNHDSPDWIWTDYPNLKMAK